MNLENSRKYRKELPELIGELNKVLNIKSNCISGF